MLRVMLILSRLSAEVFYSRPLTGCYSVYSLHYYVFNIYISYLQESNLNIYCYSRQFKLYINPMVTYWEASTSTVMLPDRKLKFAEEFSFSFLYT